MNVRLYEILNAEKPDKIVKDGVRTTSYYSFESVEKMVAIALATSGETKTSESIVDILQPQLNENQQIVLEWLKEEQTKNPELSIFGTLSVLFDESENRFMNLDVIDALNDLSNPQQEGVFQAFSKWDLGWRNECE